RHLCEISRPGSSPRRFIAGDHRSGEERLAEVNLRGRQIIAGEGRKSRRRLPGWKKSLEFRKKGWLESLRHQIVLVVACTARKRDGGQKLLQSLILLALQRQFAAFCLFEAEIVLEAAAHCLIERELQHLIGCRLQRDAAPERVGGRTRIRRLRAGN